MEILLQQKGATPRTVTAQIRLCTASDRAAMLALQDDIRAAMPRPELFLSNTEEDLAQDLQSSLCIGVWAASDLIAYGILRYCGSSPHNYAASMDIPASDWPYWANVDTVAVAPAWRGNGLQQRLVACMMEQRRPDIIGFGCTVSPDNTHSLNNMLAAGFTIRTRRMMYGCHDRYVLGRQLPPLPGEYRHFKGRHYRVEGIATHSETGEAMVVYRQLYGAGGLWVRPAAMWAEHVERDGYSGPRFVRIGP